MRARFAALARGSQPAVVKLASYGGGVRVAAMMSYASRSGKLAMENERGEGIVGKLALTELRATWEHLFDYRAASRDVALFQVMISSPLGAGSADCHDVALEILQAGLGKRRFVYALDQKSKSEFEARGVVVLRDTGGERLTADAKATAIVQKRIDHSAFGREGEIRFGFCGYGNGVQFATTKVRDLVQGANGMVQDEAGRAIEGLKNARHLVSTQWRPQLHSRKGRDVMHLIVSTRAGTDASAFKAAVRDFLGEQFAGHRYVFALHDPADDPKLMGQGGRRPHIHAHAIITTRTDIGERVLTSPRLFRQWRALMAEKAREHGIEMEMTDRRDVVAPPAYSRGQVRPVSYSGRTEHEGTSRAAQARYDDKRANRSSAARAKRSAQYILEAARAWKEVALSEPDMAISKVAVAQIGRLQEASRQRQIHIEERGRPSDSDLKANMTELQNLIEAGGAAMRTMTRAEFETYERRVEAVLAAVKAVIEPMEKTDFEEIAATAREVVDIRREYVEFQDHHAGAETRQYQPGIRANDRDRVAAKNGREDVERGNDVVLSAQSAQAMRDHAKDSDTIKGRTGFEQEFERQGRHVSGNSWLPEVAEADPGLPRVIDAPEGYRRQGEAYLENSSAGGTYQSSGSDAGRPFSSIARATKQHTRRQGPAEDERDAQRPTENRSDPSQQVPRLRGGNEGTRDDRDEPER